MTPAEISSLPSASAHHSAENGNADEDDSEDEAPLLSCLGMKSPVSPAARQPDQAACLPARASSKTPKLAKKARIPDANSAAKKRLEKAGALPGQLQQRLLFPLPKPRGPLSASPRQKQLHLTFAPLSKAEAALKATPSTPEVQTSAGGGALDPALRQSRSGRPSERAEWSHHSSDSEQHEAAADAALQDDCAAAESQPTSSSFQLAIQTLGRKTPCQPARVKTEDADHAAAATPAPIGNSEQHAAVGRLRQLLVAAPAESPPLSASVGAQQAKAALASKRSSSEALSICSKGLSGSKRLKVSGSGEGKASAAGPDVPTSPGRVAVTARKATPNMPPRPPMSAATVDEDPVHGDAQCPHSCFHQDREAELSHPILNALCFTSYCSALVSLVRTDSTVMLFWRWSHGGW